MIVLGIDFAKTTGWAVLEKTKSLGSGTIRLTPADCKDQGVRYLGFDNLLAETFKNYPNINYIIYEHVNIFNKNWTWKQDYGVYVGLIKKYAFQYEATILKAPTPPELKKYITSRGNATKEDMIASIVSKGYAPADDNEADAISLALYGGVKLRGGIDFDKSE